jgi:hypothetical protein
MTRSWLYAFSFLAMTPACANGGSRDPFDNGDGGAAVDGTYDAGRDAASTDGSPPQEASPSDPDGANADGSQPPEGASGDTGTDGTGDDAATGGDATMHDDAANEDSSAADAPESGDGFSGADGPTQDAPASTNIAPSGKGYTWQSMTSSSADTPKNAAPAVNDGNLATQANIDSASGDSPNAWEGAGVTFSSGHTVTSVIFVQGTTTSGGDGWFESNLVLQFSSDGTTWTDSGWSMTPVYTYWSDVSGKTYTFNGTQATGIEGVRVAGQVNTTAVGKSWWAAVTEVEVFGY